MDSIFNDMDMEVENKTIKTKETIKTRHDFIKKPFNTNVSNINNNNTTFNKNNNNTTDVYNSNNSNNNNTTQNESYVYNDDYDDNQQANNIDDNYDDDDNNNDNDKNTNEHNNITTDSYPVITAESIEFDNTDSKIKIKSFETKKSIISSDSFIPKFIKKTESSEPKSNSNWNNLKETMVDNSHSIDPVQSDLNVLEDDGSLKMYWIDAFERNGVVYLFGKVKKLIQKTLNKVDGKYVSCCASVNNIQRNLFILPRKFHQNGFYN